MHKYGIDREDDSPLAGTCGSEIEVDSHQTERAEEDVAIYFEERGRRNEEGEYSAPDISLSTFHLPLSSKNLPIIPPNQSQSHDETGILCNNRTPSHTLNLHPKTIDQRQ